jgi:hypothetical protein
MPQVVKNWNALSSAASGVYPGWSAYRMIFRILPCDRDGAPRAAIGHALTAADPADEPAPRDRHVLIESAGILRHVARHPDFNDVHRLDHAVSDSSCPGARSSASVTDQVPMAARTSLETVTPPVSPRYGVRSSVRAVRWDAAIVPATLALPKLAKPSAPVPISSAATSCSKASPTPWRLPAPRLDSIFFSPVNQSRRQFPFPGLCRRREKNGHFGVGAGRRARGSDCSLAARRSRLSPLLVARLGPHRG